MRAGAGCAAVVLAGALVACGGGPGSEGEAEPEGIVYDLGHQGGLALAPLPPLPDAGEPGAEVELTGRWSGRVSVAGADSVFCERDVAAGRWEYGTTAAGPGDVVVLVSGDAQAAEADSAQPSTVGVVAFTDDTGQQVTYSAVGDGEVALRFGEDRDAVAFSLLIGGGLSVTGVIRCPTGS